MTEVVTSNSGTSTTPSVAVPSNAAAKTGVLLGLFTTNATDTDATILAAMPAGFELVVAAGTQTQGVRGRILLFAKRMTGADSGSYTLGTLTSAYWEIAAVGITGLVTIGKLWNALYATTVGAASAATTQSNTGVTPGSSSAKVYAWASNSNGGNWTPPSGFTEDYDAGAKLELIHLTTGQAAATGSYTTTCSVGGYMRSLIIALSADDHVDTRSIAFYLFAATTAQTLTLSSLNNGYEAGDRLELIVSGKSETTTIPAAPTGWTLVGSGTGGTGSLAADTGQMFWAVYMRDIAAGENSTSNPISDPVLTPGGTAPNTWNAIIAVKTPATGKVFRDSLGASVDFVKAISDTDAATAVTGGTAAAMTNQPTTGDSIDVVGCFPTDAMTTNTAIAVSATGLADGVVAGLPTAVNSSTPQTAQGVSVFNRNTLGLDSAMAFFDWVEFNGTASSGITATFTHNAGNQSGVVLVIAHRQTTGATTVNLGLPESTATALALTTTTGAAVTLGLPTETDTALALTTTAGAVVSLGLPAETDTALALSVVTATVVPLGLPTETDSALALTATAGAVVTLGLPVETDTALALGTAVGAAVTLGLPVETDTALALSIGQTIHLGLPTETDTALALTVVSDATTLTIDAVVPPPTVGLSLVPGEFLSVPTDTTDYGGGIYVECSGAFDWDPPVTPRPPRLRDPVTGDIPPFHSIRDAVATVVPSFTLTSKGQPRFTPQTARIARLRPRWVVGNRDVTYWRDVPVGFGGYQKVDPLGYGPTTLLFRAASLFEYPGRGGLGWMRGGAKVRCDWVDAETDEVVIEGAYHGLVLGWELSGGYWQVTIGGQVTGPSALRNAQVQLIRGTSWTSQQVAERFRDLGIPFHPKFGGGIKNGFGHKQIRSGGTGHLENLMALIEGAQDRDGTSWTVMPDEDGVYQLTRRDLDTIHATVYFDNQNVIAELNRHLSEEPNRIYAEATSLTGYRIRFAIYPGLIQGDPPPFPNDDGTPFGEGTTDADLDDGVGVTLLVDRLIMMKRLDLDDRPDGFDAEVTRAIMDFQYASDLNVTGLVGPNTWDALYDLGLSGFSHRWAKIEPAAQDPRTQQWIRSGSGIPLRRNPRYDASILKRDVNYQMGVVKGVNRVREYAHADLEVGHVWVGSIRLKSRAMIRGEHRPGDPPITPADAMLDVEAWAGMNILEPRWGVGDDGTVFHVSAVDVEKDTGEVVLTVDTRGRAANKVWEVMEQRRETRENTARAYLDLRRSSTTVRDDHGPFDKVGGFLYQPQQLTGDAWNVFPVVAGQEGTVKELFIRTTEDTKTRWVMAVFGLQVREAWLTHRVGNPFGAGADAWANETVRRAMEDDYYCLGWWGDEEAPCGTWPKNLSRNPDAPTTGKYRDRGGFDYFTSRVDALWVAMYPLDDCTLPAGRIMKPLLGSA